MQPLVRLQGVSKFYPRVHRPGERLRAFAALLAGRHGLVILYGDQDYVDWEDCKNRKIIW